MPGKLTIVMDTHVLEWLRQFARDRDMTMGEVARIELEALYQNDMACRALQNTTTLGEPSRLPEPPTLMALDR